MSEEEVKQLKIERDNAMLERDTAIFVAKERLDIIERIKNQKEIFELRYLKADKEIERLKNGLHKLLELNNYMIHCSSKRVVGKLIMKQWRLIYEVLGEQKPGIIFASKGSDKE